MDATADKDLKLQNSAPELINKLQRSLPRFLWRTTAGHVSRFEARGRSRLLVRQSKTDQLLKLLEPFQEEPQLLDPHLHSLLDPLMAAFIDFLTQHTSEYNRSTKKSSKDCIPLSRAICQILCVFCKVRGQKVVSRFFNNEPRHLEPMVDALEAWSETIPEAETSSLPNRNTMIWQERYVMLLWLSHLTLAPFGLASMSSENTDRFIRPTSLKVDFPLGTPLLAARLFQLSASYLGYASKEKEAAAILLTRLAIKPDMCHLTLHQSIIDSVCTSFYTRRNDGSVSASVHKLIGHLLFLAKFVASAEAHVLLPLLWKINTLFTHCISNESPIHPGTGSSSLVRRLVIKLGKNIAITIAKMNIQGTVTSPSLEESALEEALDYLFSSLEDKETSIRIAASKALSEVVRHLPSYQFAAVSSQLYSELEESPAWTEPRMGQQDECGDAFGGSTEGRKLLSDGEPNFTLANPRKWHGIMLTLSQLILRTAIPEDSLLISVKNLLLALNFEQRSSLGASCGTDVRDAACLGFWSFARRYPTINFPLDALKDGPEGKGVYQCLANSLVVTATLDPSGNNRRGASAALQEMVGRHPSMIEQGIRVIQIVDYHAVALRSAAMQEVAVTVSKIHECYWDALLAGLLGWRGVGSPDAETRRRAAHAIGRLIIYRRHSVLSVDAFRNVLRKLIEVTPDRYEAEHGFFLALAGIILAIHHITRERRKYQALPDDTDAGISSIVNFTKPSLIMAMTGRVLSVEGKRRPPNAVKYILEGRCRLLSAILIVLSDEDETEVFQNIIFPSNPGKRVFNEIVKNALRQQDDGVVQAALGAAVNLYAFLNDIGKEAMVSDIIEETESLSPGSDGIAVGMVRALGAIYRYIKQSEGHISHLENFRAWQWLDFPLPWVPWNPTAVAEVLIETLAGLLEHKWSIEIRCAALSSLTQDVLRYKGCTNDIFLSIFKCLDDYTINVKGDVGSLVRIQAIEAASLILKRKLLDHKQTRQIMARVGGLAVEKLDKVRWKAWICLSQYTRLFKIYEDLCLISDMAHTSSKSYFTRLLSMATLDWAAMDFLKGYVTSAGVGSESLIKTSRAAFTTYAHGLSSDELTTICVRILKLFIHNHRDERLSLPIMQFIVFLFEANIMQPSACNEKLWRDFFRCLQEAHHRSPNIPKIEAAINIYAALVTCGPLRKVASKKLCQMLLHPYAKIRNATADSFYVITEDQTMLAVDWSRPIKELHSDVEELKYRLIQEHS